MGKVKRSGFRGEERKSGEVEGREEGVGRV